jgi:hypothetical protein
VFFYESAAPNQTLAVPAYLYGAASLLEPLRWWQWTGYVWRGVPVPRAELATVAARGQVEDQVLVPVGSWLVAFSGSCAAAAGFRFQLFDVGRDRFAITDRWVNNRAGATDTTDPDAVMHVLPEPYCIVEPGKLQVSVSNLATVANDLQLLLHFAVPVEGSHV